MYGFLSRLSLYSIPHYTWSLPNVLISEEILYPAPKHIPWLGDLFCMPSPKSLALDGYRLFPALQRFPGIPTGFPPWMSSELGRTKKSATYHSFWQPPEEWGWTNTVLFPLETGTVDCHLQDHSEPGKGGERTSENATKLLTISLAFFLTLFSFGCCQPLTAAQSSATVGSFAFSFIFQCFLWKDQVWKLPTSPFSLTSLLCDI